MNEHHRMGMPGQAEGTFQGFAEIANLPDNYVLSGKANREFRNKVGPSWFINYGRRYSWDEVLRYAGDLDRAIAAYRRAPIEDNLRLNERKGARWRSVSLDAMLTQTLELIADAEKEIAAQTATTEFTPKSFSSTFRGEAIDRPVLRGTLGLEEGHELLHFFISDPTMLARFLTHEPADVEALRQHLFQRVQTLKEACLQLSAIVKPIQDAIERLEGTDKGGGRRGWGEVWVSKETVYERRRAELIELGQRLHQILRNLPSPKPAQEGSNAGP
jgi:hypothetical protein